MFVSRVDSLSNASGSSAAAVASGLSIKIYKDEKSQTSGPNASCDRGLLNFWSAGEVISEELSKVGFDSEISESQDLYNDEDWRR